MSGCLDMQPEHLIASIDAMIAGYQDAVAGLRYIEVHYGRLGGVGWDRVFDAFDDAIKIPFREGMDRDLIARSIRNLAEPTS